MLMLGSIASESMTKGMHNRLFSLGLITDVQYANKDVDGKRRYRTSLTRLCQAVAELNTRPLEFTIQLGDCSP